MTRPPIHLLRLALLSALMLALVPATHARAETIPFKVSVKGQISERWQRAYALDYYECKPRTEESGGATITFATPKPQRATAHIDRGWRGKIVANVHSERHGTSTQRDTAGGTFCHPEPTVRGGTCSPKDFKTRVGLDFGDDPFTLGMYGNRRAHGFDCVYAPDAFPEKDQEFDVFQLLWDRGPTVRAYPFNVFGGRDAKGRNRPRKRQWTIRYKGRVNRPYWWRRDDGSRQRVGTYSADFDYVVKFRRIGPIWPGGKPPWKR